MSYHVYLFRKEVKEQNTGFEFLENENLVLNFTAEQFISLKERLLRYQFQIEKETADSIEFNFKGGQYGIVAILTKSQLSFSSGFSEDGIFEIGMTASEFTDTGDFAKFDPQLGEWEEI
ncbi:hypothetical protein [Aureispira sp. CCB-QB1]|uniref:hypothetical protein n=1 Tax=Aureispira sp. CCB-QB1 TaxID=1313421 RepID=UPI000696A872|nr:hypothetical protein [Aureispira sp. CCB-QB1]